MKFTLPKRRDLGFAFISHSQIHPVKLLVKDKQFATPPRDGKWIHILEIKKILMD
jgi:hypothetical protein